MIYVVVFLLLSAFILVHELGHLLVARRLGIPVTRFSVGIGPSVWSVERGGTEYRLAVIPLGGYVMVGLQGEGAYFTLSVAKRAMFALGGPLANVAAAAVAFAILNLMGPNAGLSSVLLEPLVQTASALGKVVATVPMIVSNSGEVSGLVGLIAEGGDYIAGGLVHAIQLSIVVNLNLAVINMLPVPPLDGGKIVLCVLEALDEGLARLHVPLNAAGWVLILGVLAYVTIQDIRRLLLA